MKEIYNFCARAFLALILASLVFLIAPYVVGGISGVFGYFYFLFLGEERDGFFASVIGWIWLTLPVLFSVLTFIFYLYLGFPKNQRGLKKGKN